MIALFCLQLSSCEDKKSQVTLNGGLVNHSECKSSKSAMVLSDVPDSVSCVNFIYDEDGKTLFLSHLNAGFNCCPESLYCRIEQKNDTIIIEEFEKSSLCSCNCLFDLDYELTGVEKQIYVIQMIEPYANNQNHLMFEIDLSHVNDGSFCVTRKQYPWGITQ